MYPLPLSMWAGFWSPFTLFVLFVDVGTAGVHNVYFRDYHNEIVSISFQEYSQRDPLVKRIIFQKKIKHFYKKRRKLEELQLGNGFFFENEKISKFFIQNCMKIKNFEIEIFRFFSISKKSKISIQNCMKMVFLDRKNRNFGS